MHTHVSQSNPNGLQRVCQRTDEQKCHAADCQLGLVSAVHYVCQTGVRNKPEYVTMVTMVQSFRRFISELGLSLNKMLITAPRSKQNIIWLAK